MSSKAPFDEWLEAYKGTVRQVAHDFPNLSLIGTQWRGATSADTIDWGAVLYDTAADTFYTAPLRTNIPIGDRTGGGDSFMSGVLAALLKGKDLADRGPVGRRTRHPGAGDARRHHDGRREGRAG